MTTCSKSGLASDLGITKARVSQYVKRGLPILPDGKIDRDAAVKWIAVNFPDRHRLNSPGVKRAAELAKAMKARSKPVQATAPDPTIEMLAELVGRGGGMAGLAVIEAGGTMLMADAVDQIVTQHLWRALDEMYGVDPGERSPFEVVVDSYLQENNTDWPVRAAEAGEKVDLTAWDAFIDALPSMQPAPGVDP